MTAAVLARGLTALNAGADFDSVVTKPVVHIARFGLRERIVRRVPWLWLLRLLTRRLPRRYRPRVPGSATELLAWYLDRKLFRRATMDDLGLSSPGLQTLILPTNVSRGGITVFSGKTVEHLPPNLDEESERIEAGLLPVAKAVAASSAFPALFPPIELNHQDVGAEDKDFRSQWFTDAGVSDNLGFDTIARVGEGPDLILVSDAGRSNLSLREQSLGILTNALRSSDLMLFRISELARERARLFQGPEVAVLSISDTTAEPGASPDVVQRPLERIRTDFDTFSDLEIEELISHGWCVAKERLDALSATGHLEPPPRRHRRPASPSRVARKLEAGALRKLRIFGPGDWLCFAYAFMLVAVLAGLATMLPGAYQTGTNYIRFVRAGSLLVPEVPTWTRGAVPAINRVPALPDDSNPGFELVSETRVWDLRYLRPQTEGNTVRMLGPAYLQRTATLGQRSGAAGIYRFRFLTSGNDFKAWRVDGAPIAIFGQAAPQISGASVMQPFIVETDASSSGPGTPIQVQAEIVNAFVDRANWWAGMRVTSPVGSIAMRIVFPREYPYKTGSTRFERYPNETPMAAASFDGVVLDREERELLWYVDSPTVGFTYRVIWDW